MARFCPVCHDPIDELDDSSRLCATCARRFEEEGRPYDSHCANCSESRAPCLRWVRVGRERTALCHNCAALYKQLKPKPRSVDAMLSRLRWEFRPGRWIDAREAGVIIHPRVPRTIGGTVDPVVASLMLELDDV
jgi:NMD protein affecting ribosome stability and mRNA decay